jgi:hypothetical protein
MLASELIAAARIGMLDIANGAPIRVSFKKCLRAKFIFNSEMNKHSP